MRIAGREFFYEEIPADLADKAAEYREKLIELAVEQDDAGDGSLSRRQRARCRDAEALIRKGTLNQSFVPVLCGSAFKNKGVQPLLDAVVDYLPSPLDIPDVQGINPTPKRRTAARRPTMRPSRRSRSRS
jgi:elongation factor G